MDKKAIHNKIIRSLKSIYLKMFRIHDSPQRVSVGFGLGVFLGILPGMGPIAALVLAAFFRVNKAAALLGCLITNTWLGFAVLVLSIKIGAAMSGLEWHETLNTWQRLLKNFHWNQLLDAPVLHMMLPVLAGYLVLSVSLALIVYVTALCILLFLKRQKKPNN